MALGGALAGFARVVLETDNRKLKSGLREAESDFSRTTQRMRTSLAGFARAMSGFALAGGAAGLGIVLKKSLDAASDLNEEVDKAKVVFRGSSREMLAWAKTTDAAFGLSERAALQGAGAVGNMLRTVGVLGPELGKMSRDLVELAADMASFSNQNPEEMLERLRSGLAGEAEPLRQFGVLLSEARVKQEAVRMGLVRQGVDLTEQEKVLARYNIILHDTTVQHGNFGQTAQSNANQQRILRAELENIEATLGKELLPIQVAVIGQLADWAKELQDNKELQRELKQAIEDVVDITGDAIGVVQQIVDEMGGWENASKFILAGTLLARVGALTKAFTLLAGSEAAAGAAGGTGIAGAAGSAATLLSRLRALSVLTIVIPIALKLFDDATGNPIRDINRWIYNHITSPLIKGLTAGTVDLGQIGGRPRRNASAGGAAPGFVGPGAVVEGGGAFAGRPGGGTHSRSERGYIWQDDDAVDINMRPGAKVYAIEDGFLRGARYGGDSGRFSGWGVTLVADSGAMYFYKHLRSLYRRQGRVKRGEVIGAGTTTGHLHFAKKGATTAEQVLGATGAPYTPPAAGGGGGGAPPPTGPPRGGNTGGAGSLIPLGLEEELAEAEITKGTADDIRALKKIEAYLEKRIAATKNVKKKIELLRELKQTQSQLASLTGRQPKRGTKGLEDLIPPVLENKLARAELTKTLDDDLAALKAIEEYLVKKLAQTKKLTEQNRILRQLKDVRAQMEGILGEIGADKKAIDKLIGDIILGTDDLVRGPLDARSTHMFAPGTDYQAQITTKEGKEELTKVLASLEPEKQRIRDWAQELDLKKKAAIQRRDTLKAQLKKLDKTPVRLRTRRWRQARANLVAAIAQLNAVIKELDEGINRAFEMWADIEATESSEVQRVAGEDEQRRSAPPEADRGGGGGGGGGGGDFGGGGGGSTAPSGPTAAEIEARIRAEVDRNVVGFLGGTRDMRGLASNLYQQALAGTLGLGPGGRRLQGATTIVINQAFPQTPDPLTFAKGIEFELRALAS